MAIWTILRKFGISDDHLVHFVFIWHIYSGFGIITEKNLATLLKGNHLRGRCKPFKSKKTKEKKTAIYERQQGEKKKLISRIEI
jgi:hypothetical protein